MTGTEIQMAREALGLSQPQAAALWGITLTTLRDTEQGRSANASVIGLLTTVIRYYRAFGPLPGNDQ